MKYAELLKLKRPCPFCDPSQRVFVENRTAFLTYSIAPYAKYHLLVIPKRHDKSFSDITSREWKDLHNLMTLGAGILRKKGITDYTILIRNGSVGTGRSVEHLHFHIVPNHRIGDLDNKGKTRMVMSSKAIAKLTKEIEALLKKKR